MRQASLRKKETALDVARFPSEENVAAELRAKKQLELQNERLGIVLKGRDQGTDLKKLGEELASITRQLADQRLDHAPLVDELAEAQQAHRAAQDIRDQYMLIEAAIPKREALAEKSKKTMALQAEVPEQRQNLEDVEEAIAQKKSGQERLSQDHARLDAEIEATAREVSALQETTSKVTGALALLAAQVDDSQKQCPLCLHDWGDPVSLKRQVTAAEDAAAEPLRRAERRLKKILGNQNRIVHQQKDIEEKITLLEHKRGTLLADLREARKEYKALLADPSWVDGPGQDPLRSAKDMLASTKARLKALAAEMNASGFGNMEDRIGVLQARVARSSEEISKLETAAREREQQIEAGEAEKQELLEMGRLKDPGGRDGWDDLIRQVRDDLASAKNTYSSAQEQLRQSIREQAIQKASASAANQELHHLMVEQKSVSADSLGLEQKWSAADLVRKPSKEVLSAALLQNTNEISRMSGARRRLEQLRTGLKRWRLTDQLQHEEALLKKILPRYHVKDEQHLEVEMQRTLKEKKAAIQRLDVVDRRIKALRELLKEESDRFYQDVLAPLNEVAARFDAALAVRRRFELEHVVRDPRGTGSMELRAGTSSFEFAANHVLSEGQLRSAELVQLLSMSVSIPWSDWRCLLLDDPVQSNDIIHVAAFIDLLRNLMAEQRYQVILSTHDPEITEFFGRKMAAFPDLPLNVISFLSSDSSGVSFRQDRWQ